MIIACTVAAKAKGCGVKSVILLALIGIVAAVVSQLGDLSASLIKRECSVKDFGNILPGHGGVLDRFDSVLFAAPFAYMLFQIYAPITQL